MLDSLIDLRIHGNETWQNKSIYDIFSETYLPFVKLLRNDECKENIDDSLNAFYMRISRSQYFVDYAANYHSYTINEQLSQNIWNKTFGSYNIDNNINHENPRYLFENWKKHIRYYGKKLEETVFAVGSTAVPQECLNNFENENYILKTDKSAK